MRIAGHDVRDYAAATTRFLPIVIVGQAIGVVLRVTNRESAIAQNALVAMAFLVAGWTGWDATRRRGFALRSAALTGVLLSLGTIWALPVFHGARGVIAFGTFNAALFGALAAVGAWLAGAGHSKSTPRP